MNSTQCVIKYSWIGLILLLLTGCSEPDPTELIIYSGRSQALVDELVADFEDQTGTTVKVRYGNDAELLAVLGEEGEQSPADVYWANTTGALANASGQGMLVQLPDSLLNKPASYTSSSGEWVPVTVRFRVLAYNPQNVNAEDLPQSVLDLPELQQFEGRIGWTPTYSSFYDFITAMRLTEGDERAREWLQGMEELNPKPYSSNTPMVQAIAAGEIDIALTNHYYVLRMKQGGTGGEYADTDSDSDSDTNAGGGEPNPDAALDTYHFASGDIGNLALVTGAAQLQTAKNPALAQQFLSFLLSRQAQEFAAQSVHEYPVIRELELPSYLLNEEESFELSPDYDYEQLQQLEGTLNLLREVGLI